MLGEEWGQEDERLRFVNFSLAGELYGQDIRYIHEVNRGRNLTDIPGSPDYILGVINLRGDVIPVMDLRKRLGLPPKEMTKDSRIIVVEYEQSKLGLMVDSVHNVLEIPISLISKPPGKTMTDRNRFINGIGRLDNNMIFFIDIGHVFDEEIGLAEHVHETAETV